MGEDDQFGNSMMERHCFKGRDCINESWKFLFHDCKEYAIKVMERGVEAERLYVYGFNSMNYNTKLMFILQEVRHLTSWPTLVMSKPLIFARAFLEVVYTTLHTKWGDNIPKYSDI